jgi:hypothetical protein
LLRQLHSRDPLHLDLRRFRRCCIDELMGK